MPNSAPSACHDLQVPSLGKKLHMPYYVTGHFQPNRASRKVERPMARLSEAPMRVCTASNTCIRADSAGTNDPTWSPTHVCHLVQAACHIRHCSMQPPERDGRATHLLRENSDAFLVPTMRPVLPDRQIAGPQHASHDRHDSRETHQQAAHVRHGGCKRAKALGGGYLG